MNTDIEKRAVRSFIIPQKRARALFELNNPRKRRDYIARIQWDLEPALIRPVKTADRDEIYRMLREAGAPDTCYILDTGEYDGKEFPLREGLDILDYEFALMICDPDRIAFFRGPDTKGRMMIRK